MSVSEIARFLKRCEQRIRQLADADTWPMFRDPGGKRWIHMPSVRAWDVDRQVLRLMTGARKTGPKGPRRSVKPGAFTREFEGATA